MKKKFIYLFAGALTFTACSLVELDNYDAPSETLRGKVLDKNGAPVLTNQGSEGIRVRLTELSWTGSETPTPNPDFYCRPDGTFQNTKLFKGNYEIELTGPFVPTHGESVVVEREISGVTEMDFVVQPFLKVEWVETPTVADGKITAKIKVTRVAQQADFPAEANISTANLTVTDAWLFVSYTSSVGFRGRDDRWSKQVDGIDAQVTNGDVITIVSEGTIPAKSVVFVSAAARINYSTQGHRRYNYTDIRRVDVP